MVGIFVRSIGSKYAINPEEESRRMKHHLNIAACKMNVTTDSTIGVFE